MRRVLLVALMALASACGVGAPSAGATIDSAIEHTTVVAPRGARIPVEIHLSSRIAKKPMPVLVIAPGSGYHMRLPLTAWLAEAAAETGVAAVCFDWAYCAYDAKSGECAGRATRDRAPEVEDLRAVLASVRSDPRFDANRIVLAGKSRGSVIAYDVFRADTALAGAILLTPLCTGEDDSTRAPTPIGAKLYPGLASERRPVLFLLGNADENCLLPMLYELVREAGSHVAVATFGGGHGLEVEEGSDGSGTRSARNQTAACKTAAVWANLMLGR